MPRNHIGDPCEATLKKDRLRTQSSVVIAERFGDKHPETCAEPYTCNTLSGARSAMNSAMLFGPAHAAASLHPTDVAKRNSKMVSTHYSSDDAAYMRATASVNSAHNSPRQGSSFTLASDVPSSASGAFLFRSRLSHASFSYSDQDSAFYDRRQEWNDSAHLVSEHSPSWQKYNRDDSLNMDLVSAPAHISPLLTSPLPLLPLLRRASPPASSPCPLLQEMHPHWVAKAPGTYDSTRERWNIYNPKQQRPSTGWNDRFIAAHVRSCLPPLSSIFSPHTFSSPYTPLHERYNSHG